MSRFGVPCGGCGGWHHGGYPGASPGHCPAGFQPSAPAPSPGLIVTEPLVVPRSSRASIDLTDHLGIDSFDDVMKTIDAVVEESQSLSLDSAADRRTLKRLLATRLGAVIGDDVEDDL